jgi:competence protein ComGC
VKLISKRGIESHKKEAAMKRRAITLVEVLLVILIVTILIAIILPVRNKRYPVDRSTCASNLKQIYTAMVLYGEKNNSVFPMIDLAEGTIVGEDTVPFNRISGKEENPYKDIPFDAGRSVSQNLWLLVRGDKYIKPKLFNCPASEQAGQEFVKNENAEKDENDEPKCFVDFPYKKSGMTISYSFVQPWSKFKDGKTSTHFFWSYDIGDSRVAIGADANNGKQPDHPVDTMPKSWFSNKTDLNTFINSTNHKGEGQCVVYGDGRVSFEKSAYVGIHQDNIYTAQPAEYVGEAGKTPGVLSVRPKNGEDSVLVPNREADLKAWDRKP